MPPQLPPQLPSFALYGEPDRSPAADPLHCESISARSRLHGWEIKPHRHDTLVQVLWLARGRARMLLDGNALSLAGPAVVTVPAQAAHGFSFSPNVDGLVFTVDERHWRRLLAGAEALCAAVLQPRGWALSAASAPARTLDVAARALCGELRAAERWRGPAIDAGLLRLAVAVARALPATPAQPGAAPERALSHAERYRALVEGHYKQQPALATMAAQLHITPTQLNRVCRQVLGVSALHVLHARLVLEAQRDLAYTTMSVKQIALDLGFADAAYFTRFFQRRAGCAPTAWRLRAGLPASA